MDIDRMVITLKRQEGLVLVPYRDSEENWTIGYGHKLVNGIEISRAVASILLIEDVERAVHEFKSTRLDQFLNEMRQEVCVNMVFNLGLKGFLGFVKMIACIEGQDFYGAAVEMLQSKWHEQVGNRAKELAEVMRTGKCLP